MGSKPEPEEAAVASYNVACCYSKLNQVNVCSNYKLHVADLHYLEDTICAGLHLLSGMWI